MWLGVAPGTDTTKTHVYKWLDDMFQNAITISGSIVNIIRGDLYDHLIVEHTNKNNAHTLSQNKNRRGKWLRPQNSEPLTTSYSSNHVWEERWPFKAHLLRSIYLHPALTVSRPIVLETHECIFYCQNMAWCLQVKVEAMFWVNCRGEPEGSLWLSKPEGNSSNAISTSSSSSWS